MNHTRHDPWAHRRGEPRVFALAWSLYLLAAVTGAIVWIVRGQTTASAAGPAARIVLVVINIGIVVGWPMVRLSQRSPRDERPPRSASGSALVDMLIVFVPAQVIVWPLSWVARWPLEIAAAIVGLMAAWSLLTCAVVALATGPLCPSGRLLGLARTLWMVLWLAVLGTPAILWAAPRGGGQPPGPANGWRDGQRRVPGWVPTASPLSAVHAMTGKTLSGVVDPLTPRQWEALAAPALLGTGLWTVAALSEAVLSRRRRPARSG